MKNFLIKFPAFLNIISIEQIKECRAYHNNKYLIIAAGKVPNSNIVKFITANGKIYNLDLEKHGIAIQGEVRPSDWGHGIMIGDNYEMAPDWVVCNAAFLRNII